MSLAHSRHWLVLLMLALILSAGVAIGVAWLLWPVECVSTAIGCEPDPNVHACQRRIGGSVALEHSRVAAVLWGQLWGLGVLFVACGLILWRERRKRGFTTSP